MSAGSRHARSGSPSALAKFARLLEAVPDPALVARSRRWEWLLLYAIAGGATLTAFLTYVMMMEDPWIPRIFAAFAVLAGLVIPLVQLVLARTRRVYGYLVITLLQVWDIFTRFQRWEPEPWPLLVIVHTCAGALVIGLSMFMLARLFPARAHAI